MSIIMNNYNISQVSYRIIYQLNMFVGKIRKSFRNNNVIREIIMSYCDTQITQKFLSSITHTDMITFSPKTNELFHFY
jgi:hypothetical protein